MGVLKQAVKHVLKSCGYTISKVEQAMTTPALYQQDGLQSIHNHDFMRDPAFVDAYSRGLKACAGVDNLIHWRVHVAVWVAACAARLRGDFVECGVNKGFNSSAIMRYLDWNSLNKTFYLLDTFNGIDVRFVLDEEKMAGKLEWNQKVLDTGGYERSVEAITQNFSEWQRVKIIPGAVPETLPQVDAKEVAFLHLDMNCAIPEQAAAEYFWPRMVPGGLMLFDDYGYVAYEPQKVALDQFAHACGVTVLSLPTGQGLVIKPPAKRVKTDAAA